MIELQPEAMRATWSAYGDDADAEFRDARQRCPGAGSHDLDALSNLVQGAADDMARVFQVVQEVLEEHRSGMEECIDDFEHSDGNTAGEFNALAR